MNRWLVVFLLAGCFAANFVVGTSLLLAFLNPVQVVNGMPFWGIVIGASWEIIIEIPLTVAVMVLALWFMYRVIMKECDFG